MNSRTDQQLLTDYAERRYEAAFAELVRRHIDFVYSAALRMVRDTHLAEDVTQGVFVAVAQNVRQLADCAVLPGWLHRTTQNLAANAIRSDVRRRAREQEAAVMNELLSAHPDTNWEHIAPYLDDALGELSEPDRDAVLLRYFKNHDLRTVGATLGISDDAAQKRVSRAVERLREFFAKRGVSVGASGLVGGISANAVQAAPVGLALTISTTAALTGTTLATAATVTATKAIAMTALQKTIITATIAVLAGAGIYEARQASILRSQNELLQQQQAPLVEQIQQLQHERDDVMKRLAALSAKPTPRLPAPPLQVITSKNALLDDLHSTNLYARFKDKSPKLTAEQVEGYLKANGRKASSLLAAYRTSGDPARLKEAMEKYPNDPQVAFEAVYAKDLSPEQQRQWLNTFEQSAPDNALANYLSARNYFKAGQTDQAVQELVAASGKQQFQNYTLDRWKDDEEAYLSAGYSAAEAGYLSTFELALPQLAPVKQLGQDLVDLANAYRQSGDPASAQAALQMAVELGRRYVPTSAGEGLLNQLVGLAVEKTAFSAMDPQSPYGDNGQTVQDHLNQVEQQRTALKELGQQAGSLLEKTRSDQDWINYIDRWMIFGELAAAQWLVNKYGQQ